MKEKLSKCILFPLFAVILFHTPLGAQSPSAPIILESPFEPIVTISAGVQRGWGQGSISDLNHTGIFGVADFARYKFQLAVGITENENFKNSFSFNSGISISLGSKTGRWIFQPALYTGFGYTSIYISNSEKIEMLNMPFGISIGLDGPIPFGDINISISPKMQFRHLKAGTDENVLGAGVNVGILYTPTGKRLGLRVGFDFLNVKRVPQLESELERSFLVGLEYVLN